MTWTKVCLSKLTICFRNHSKTFMSLAISMCKLGKSMKKNWRFPTNGSEFISGANIAETVPSTVTPTTEMFETSIGTPAGPCALSFGFTQNSGPDSHVMSASTCRAWIPFKLLGPGRTFDIRGGTLPGSSTTDTSSMLISGRSAAALCTASSIVSVPFLIMNCLACGQKHANMKFNHSTSWHCRAASVAIFSTPSSPPSSSSKSGQVAGTSGFEAWWWAFADA
mmetsp:Transcript_6218/g.14870  ORF Transcript_6218/g.14870 Transcript_6218/m.14870 type:complete len:223 (+) Transcript_6218:1585-2253(+)